MEKNTFLVGLESLEEAISSFLHVCFVANLCYPKGSGIFCTFLQRIVAKLDENGTTAKQTKKDQTAKGDKSGKAFDKVFSDYATKVHLLQSRKWKKYRSLPKSLVMTRRFFSCSLQSEIFLSLL